MLYIFALGISPTTTPILCFNTYTHIFAEESCSLQLIIIYLYNIEMNLILFDDIGLEWVNIGLCAEGVLG